MRFFLKQKYFSIGNDFSVRDGKGKEAFYIDGKGFTFGQQLSFQDTRRKEIAFISQKLFSFRKTFHITSNKRLLAVITRSPFSFGKSFRIRLPGRRDIKVRGKLIEHEYRFFRENELIGAVSKKWFRSTDSYGVDIQNPADILVLLGSAVVIDLLCHPGRA